MDKQAQLDQILDELNNLTESTLYEYRTENGYHAVLGEGDPDADIMFIGEAPGEQEAKKGRPFVGASGRMLNQLLDSVGIKREDVYITNIVKDRPPNNRNPRVGEIKLYSPFLMRQIEIIQPKVIAPLGRFSMEFILKQLESDAAGGKISQLHGQKVTGTTSYGEVTIVPLFHPAVALYNEDQRDTIFEDIRTLEEFAHAPA